MHEYNVIVDRRTRPSWAERRDDLGQMPSGGARGGQIVRSRAGRRPGEDQAKVWPIAAPWMQSVQAPQAPPSGPYRMPSGQLING